MNFNNLFPSDYLKSGDIEDGDTMVLTITGLEMREIGQGDSAQEKPVLFFEEVEKGLVLNKTNATTITEMYGPETDGWTGKKITLFPTQVDFQGKSTMALRVKLIRKNPSANKQQIGKGGQPVKTYTPAQVVEWLNANQATLAKDAQNNAATMKRMAADIGADLSEAKNLTEAFTLLMSYAQEQAEQAKQDAANVPF